MKTTFFECSRLVARLLGWKVSARVQPRRYRVASPVRQARLQRELKERIKTRLALG